MNLARRRGEQGERDIIAKVKCPHCRSRLMQLPPSFPIYDVQCTRCLFRAQVKSARTKPKGELFGGGWEIMEKSLRAGQLVPPLIVNFRWRAKGKSCQAIYFFPFISKANMRPRTRSRRGRRPGYREFNYVNLLKDNVPRISLLLRGV
jgi:DNA-directed RNA polymerase subunit RPC12/RpoP